MDRRTFLKSAIALPIVTAIPFNKNNIVSLQPQIEEGVGADSLLVKSNKRITETGNYVSNYLRKYIHYNVIGSTVEKEIAPFPNPLLPAPAKHLDVRIILSENDRDMPTEQFLDQIVEPMANALVYKITSFNRKFTSAHLPLLAGHSDVQRFDNKGISIRVCEGYDINYKEIFLSIDTYLI